MFTFGYKTSFSSILRALATIGIGLVMIFDNAASVTVVKVVAAFLLASGIVSWFMVSSVTKGTGCFH